jgi:hypothetical protein
MRPVAIAGDAEELARQAGVLKRYGCHTIRWNHSRVQRFQDATSYVAIMQARLLINWNKWRGAYLNTPRATIFDMIVRKQRAVRGVRQRMAEHAASKAAVAAGTEAVKAVSTEAVKAVSTEAVEAVSTEAVKADSADHVVRNAAGTFIRSSTH